jgi:hypothetical protein
VLPAATRSSQQLELAYDAGQKTLDAQTTSLGNVKTRANTLLSTAALFVSFSTGLGLISADQTKGPVLSTPKALALLGVVLVLGLCTLFVYWPVNPWHYTVSAEKLMQQSEEATKEELQEYVVRALTQGVEDNQFALDAKQVAFRLAAGLLILEIVLLVAFLTLCK